MARQKYSFYSNHKSFNPIQMLIAALISRTIKVNNIPDIKNKKFPQESYFIS